VIRRIADNCRASAIHREHLAFALLIATIEVCANVNVPKEIFAALVTAMVLAREIVMIAYDEIVAPVTNSGGHNVA